MQLLSVALIPLCLNSHLFGVYCHYKADDDEMVTQSIFVTKLQQTAIAALN